MHHYLGSGLRNVWLANGYREVATAHGKGVAIDDADGLARAIARELARRPGRLSGAEFRYLRKELELSQAALAELLGSTDQAVARWEKGRTRVPKWADRLARLLWREHAEGNVKVRGLIERLNAADEAKAARLVLERRPSGWREAA